MLTMFRHTIENLFCLRKFCEIAYWLLLWFLMPGLAGQVKFSNLEPIVCPYTFHPIMFFYCGFYIFFLESLKHIYSFFFFGRRYTCLTTGIYFLNSSEGGVQGASRISFSWGLSPWLAEGHLLTKSLHGRYSVHIQPGVTLFL